MRRGRKARHANPPKASAIHPGMQGGQYRPLSAHDIDQISDTVFEVLQNIGMGTPIPILVEHALARGCHMNEHGRLCFPRSLVEDVIAYTPKAFPFMGREPKLDLELGGERVFTYGGGEAVNMLDPGASAYRPSRLEDIYDAARLVDRRLAPGPARPAVPERPCRPASRRPACHRLARLRACRPGCGIAAPVRLPSASAPSA